ncbi:MAG: transposase [Planctomycetaceae bacterium]|nr:transposase [Planctomycetaceae bacterium]
MTTRRRKRHTPEQIVRKLRDADAMLNAGKEEEAVLQALEVSESTYLRWRKQYGGMKAEEAKRLKELEDENRKLKEIVAEKELDIKMLRHLQQGIDHFVLERLQRQRSEVSGRRVPIGFAEDSQGDLDAGNRAGRLPVLDVIRSGEFPVGGNQL